MFCFIYIYICIYILLLFSEGNWFFFYCSFFLEGTSDRGLDTRKIFLVENCGGKMSWTFWGNRKNMTSQPFGVWRIPGASGESSQHRILIGEVSIKQQRRRSVLCYPSDHFHHTLVLARLSSYSRRRIRILLIAHSSFLQPEILDFWRFSDLEEGVMSISSSCFGRGYSHLKPG